MKAISTTRLPALLLATLFVLPGCGYNRLIAQGEATDAAWSEIDNQLQRRNDLVPNLVATVKGFAAHEQEVLTQVTEARSRVAGAGTPADKMAASNELSGALSRLLVVVERYPDPDDRRGVLGRLTTEGRQAVDGAFEALLAAEHDLIAELPAWDRSRLAALLRPLLAPFS